MQKFVPTCIYVDEQVQDSPWTERILAQFPDTPHKLVADAKELKKPIPMTEAKKMLFLTRFQGETVKTCQGLGDYVCCEYRTISLVSNCHLECSYCILQDYLKNNPVITLFVNVEEILQGVASYLDKNPSRHFRIGTGELSDSLALDPITGFSQALVPFAASQPNMTLELKTKSDQVDQLLDLDHRGRTVISWSVNPQNYITQEEHKCSSLMARLNAARKVADAGYPVAFHFDPLLDFDDWKNEYRGLVKLISEMFAPSDIAWVSMGSLRFTPGLAATVKERWPKSRLLDGELFPNTDGKVRYLRTIREELYSFVKGELEEAFPQTTNYLCMESSPVWKNVYKEVPQSTGELEKRFAI